MPPATPPSVVSQMSVTDAFSTMPAEMRISSRSVTTRAHDPHAPNAEDRQATTARGRGTSREGRRATRAHAKHMKNQVLATLVTAPRPS